MAMLSRRWREDSLVNSRKEIGQAIGLLLFLSCFKIVVAVIIDLSTGLYSVCTVYSISF